MLITNWKWHSQIAYFVQPAVQSPNCFYFLLLMTKKSRKSSYLRSCNQQMLKFLLKKWLKRLTDHQNSLLWHCLSIKKTNNTTKLHYGKCRTLSHGFCDLNHRQTLTWDISASAASIWTFIFKIFSTQVPQLHVRTILNSWIAPLMGRSQRLEAAAFV